jgi:2-hydroxy-3-keto-5-methylthiopentenyl-1-phosphate phosphatase
VVQGTTNGSPRIVLDWDGTVTEIDSLHMVLEEFGDVSLYEQAERRLGRELTLHEVIALEFSSVRTPLETVVAWVREHVRVRAGFRELVEQHDPVILSSGFTELIEPVLDREGVSPRLIANSLDASPDGWRVVFRDDTPCPVCGEACKRGSLPAGEIVYVGDGFSDRCAALASSRVFARDGLARWLDAQGASYEPWSDFGELLERL